MNITKYQDLLSTDISDAMELGYAMDIGITSLLQPAPALQGFAYTVRCYNKSNTYLHDAIYSAPQGSVIVVEADENNYAVAGGNVCAVAQENGIAGMVIDGVVRDLGEIRNIQFPVFARGVFPKPGNKSKEGESQVQINCGHVTVNTGDFIAADEEGIVVVPKADTEAILDNALAKKAKAEQQSLADWRKNHQAKINQIVVE